MQSGGTVCIVEAWSAQWRLGLPSQIWEARVCTVEAYYVRVFPPSREKGLHICLRGLFENTTVFKQTKIITFNEWFRPGFLLMATTV